MALHPERYPPGLGKAAKDLLGAWRRGEVKLCSWKAIREFRRISKEDRAKFHVASQLERMTTEYIPNIRISKQQDNPQEIPIPSLPAAPSKSEKSAGKTARFADEVPNDATALPDAFAATTCAPPI